MNLRGSDRLRVLMMGAVAVGMIGPQPLVHAADTVPILTNLKKPAATAKPAVTSAPPRLLSASETDSTMIRTVSQTEAVAAANGQKSEVMRQLELLYEKDGREMPDLNTDIKPVPNGPNTPGVPKGATNPRTQTVPQAPQQAAPAATQSGIRTQQPAAVQKSPAAEAAPAKSKYPVVAFFKKMMPGRKDPKPTKAPAEYRPDVAPVPPGLIAQPPAPLRHDPLAGVPATISGQGLPPLDSQPRTPFVSAAPLPESLPKPLAGFADIPPSPNADVPIPGVQLEVPLLIAEPKSVETKVAEVPVPKQGADTGNPFTEMSEAEADQKLKLNPFTGLTLDADAGSAKASSGAPAGAPKVATLAPPGAPAADDPFAEEMKRMGVVPSGTESTAEASKSSPSDSPTFDGIEDQATRDKMKKIHERGSMKGLKGFCPVTLRDQRELVDAKPDFHSTYRGQKFHFADADAKLKFDEEPARFAPAAYGADVVALTRDKDVVEGSLDFAAWFKGRLYLFGAEEAHDTFVADPSKYATPVGIE